MNHSDERKQDTPRTLLSRLQKWLHPAQAFYFDYDHILGTSVSLQFTCCDATFANKANDLALDEIRRLEIIFSTFMPDSVLNRWVGTQRLPSELAQVLDLAEAWRTRTNGAYCASLTHPLAAWMKDSDGRYTRFNNHFITLNSVAKGFIIDRICALVTTSIPDITGAVVNIGGDIFAYGIRPVEAGIQSTFDNEQPLCRIWLRNQALATSGVGRRGTHLIDPRSNETATHIKLVSVIAPSAALADILSTVCAVLRTHESLALIDMQVGAACFIVEANGGIHKSKAWLACEQRH